MRTSRTSDCTRSWKGKRRLPARRTTSRPPGWRPANGSRPSRCSSRATSVKVLYLDDEQPLVYLVSRMLEHLGHPVSRFTNAAEALQAFTAGPREFGLALTDMSMPGMSGLEFAQQILANDRRGSQAVGAGERGQGTRIHEWRQFQLDVGRDGIEKQHRPAQLEGGGERIATVIPPGSQAAQRLYPPYLTSTPADAAERP